MAQFSKVIFEPKTYVDIALASRLCDIEVSGLAKVKKEGNLYVIHGEVEIFDQICSINGTHLDPKSLNVWLQNTRSREITEQPDNKSSIPLFRMWWHSHVYSRSLPSEQDRETMNEVWGPIAEWQIMMIINKLDHVYLELDVFSPIFRSVEFNTFGFTERFSFSDYARLLQERENKIRQLIALKVREIMPFYWDDSDDD